MNASRTDNIARGNHVVPTEWAEDLERELTAVTEQRDRLAEALEKALNATVLNHRRDRWYIDAEHTIQLIKNQSTTNPNEL
jgi:hypothetical protein